MKYNEKFNFCDVVFPIPVNNTYTYKISEVSCDYNNLVGRRVKVDFGRQKDKIGIIVETKKEISLNNFNNIKSIKKIIDFQPLFDREQLSTAKFLSDIYGVSLGIMLDNFFHINKEVLFKEGILVKEEILKDDIDHIEFLDIIKKINKLGKKKYLFSPKNIEEKYKFYTDILLYSVKNNLKTVFLFPSKLYVDSFNDHINTNLKFLTNIFSKIKIYSGENSLEDRYRSWYLFRSGYINIMVTTKIGCFLPFNDISYIVVDEPESLSYRNPEAPCYDALLIIDERINLYHHTKLIYSSYMPSVVNKHNCYSLRKIAFYYAGNKNIYLTKHNLISVITKSIYKFSQILVILPYRGRHDHLSSFICLICKKIISNRVVLKMVKQKIPIICPECGSVYLKKYVSNIDKIRNLLKNKFQIATIEEINAELKKEEIFQMISNFNKRKTDILLCTLDVIQYMDKINFSSVGSLYFALVEELLLRPSYLSYENLIRIIRTIIGFLPEDKNVEIYIEYTGEQNIEVIKEYIFNYNKFFKEELDIRKSLCFPPFSHLVRIDILCDKEEMLDKYEKNLIIFFREKNNIKFFVEKKIQKNYRRYELSFLLKLLDFNKDYIKDVILKIKSIIGDDNIKMNVIHNPL
ncbi:MAG: hypothetical protein N2643_05780 [Endomicrobia bacterium]|nr:hypothetical protein [Endomicrobiia bacterium]